MINLVTHTEFSFRESYGKIKDIITNSCNVCSITDKHNTFGHIKFYNECKKQGKKPILGVELSFVNNVELHEKQIVHSAVLLAINREGLKKIYSLVSKATSQKYYIPRLNLEELRTINEKDIVIIFFNRKCQSFLKNRENTYYGITPLTNFYDFKRIKGFKKVACSYNSFDKPYNSKLYNIIIGTQARNRTELSHLLNENEWKQETSFLTREVQEDCLNNCEVIANKIEEFEFEKAELPKQQINKTLKELCVEGAIKLNCDLNNKVYSDRLEKELKIIHEKNFSEYFFIVSDLIEYSKKHMLVGCGRGSSAGSLVCYLLGITDIDPIPFDLIFERFIDINRNDMPDIDIDFQDTKREGCIEYLQEKYGKNYVAKLGVISQYKPKILLTEIAKLIDVKAWEMKDFKESIDEKIPLEETFKTEVGTAFIQKFPKLKYAQYIENHSRHSGQHAAGIVVANKPLNHFCSVDRKMDCCMIDKNDAKIVNLLKIDCLGLKTLNVIQNCLDLIGKDRDWLVKFPLNDNKVLNIINDRKYYGIFQFEGDALISICKQMIITCFNDLALITALARPGTLQSGGTKKYIVARKNETTEYLPHCEEYTKESLGIIVYQEQVMKIVKEIGKLSWEDTSTVRKAMSKSYGVEFLNKFREKFVEGACENGLNEKEALRVWENISTMGAWTFNKSHSISYAMISYWCMILKAYYPMQFALSTLKNANKDEQALKVIKELINEGYEFETFNQELSEIDWCIKDGKLIGGYKNIKGVGPKKAETLIKKRKEGKELTACEKRLLYNAITPFDEIFEFKKFKPFFDNWNLFMLEKPLNNLGEIELNTNIKFLAKTIKVSIKEKENIRFPNKKSKNLDLIMVDDKDTVKCRINSNDFIRLGKDILENHKVGNYYLVSGRCLEGFKFVIIDNIKKITFEEVEEKIEAFYKSQEQ